MKTELLTSIIALLVLPFLGGEVTPARDGGALVAGNQLGAFKSGAAADLAKEYRAQHIQELEMEALHGDELSLDELSVCCPKEYKAVVITMRQMAEEEKRA